MLIRDYEMQAADNNEIRNKNTTKYNTKRIVLLVEDKSNNNVNNTTQSNFTKGHKLKQNSHHCFTTTIQKS